MWINLQKMLKVNENDCTLGMKQNIVRFWDKKNRRTELFIEVAAATKNDISQTRYVSGQSCTRPRGYKTITQKAIRGLSTQLRLNPLTNWM